MSSSPDAPKAKKNVGSQTVCRSLGVIVRTFVSFQIQKVDFVTDTCFSSNRGGKANEASRLVQYLT